MHNTKCAILEALRCIGWSFVKTNDVLSEMTNGGLEFTDLELSESALKQYGLFSHFDGVKYDAWNTC